MDLNLTTEQQDIKKAARDFAEREFQDVARECDSREEFPKELWEKACKLGFVGCFIDEEYSGNGLSLFDTSLIMEEFFRVDPGCGTIMLTTYGSELIHYCGSLNQKKRYLPSLAKGDSIISIGFVERNVGNDVTSFETFLASRNNGYRLDGHKSIVFNGGIADNVIIVSINKEGKELGVSSAIVNRETRGFCSKNIVGKLGLRPLNVAEITLEDVPVEEGNIISSGSKGFYDIREFLEYTRLYGAGQGVGIAQGAFERAIDYAKKRKQFGHTISEFEAIRYKVAEMGTRLEAARTLFYAAGGAVKRKVQNRSIACKASSFAGEVAVFATAEAFQIQGGYSFCKDLDIERFYRDAQALRVWNGTGMQEKEYIAAGFLGELTD